MSQRPIIDSYAELVADAWLKMSGFRDALRRRGWVHMDDELTAAPLAPIQRAILDAGVFGVGVITRGDDGSITNLDPKESVVFSIAEVEEVLRQVTSGEWTDQFALKYLYDPLVHALVSILVENGLIPSPKTNDG
ncbi:MAG TPA: hypothetical protein VFT30_03015 [Nitrospira sp.]|nr:hypothetical protein [Nitrospira sp.]